MSEVFKYIHQQIFAKKREYPLFYNEQCKTRVLIGAAGVTIRVLTHE